MSPLRVLVSSSWYLPSPLSPLVIVCTLAYVADKLVELIWDFFPSIGGNASSGKQGSPLTS